MIDDRSWLLPLALAGLLAAGCGKAPAPAEPASPPAPPAPTPVTVAPAPVPPKPADVVWGEAANGLQLGLQVVGGREEMRLRRFADLTRVLARLTGPEQGMPVMQALAEAAKAPELSHMKALPEALYKDVAGGHTLSEAIQKHPELADKVLLDSVKAGEAAGDLPLAIAKLAGDLAGKVRPRGNFVEGEELVTFVFLRNSGERGRSLQDSMWRFDLQLRFSRLDSSPPIRYRDPTNDSLDRPPVIRYHDPSNGWKDRGIYPLALPPGAELATALEVPAEDSSGFSYERASDGNLARPKGLPGGRYAVTAVYEPHDRQHTVPCWLGRIASGPVEIEIKAKATPAVSEARAREIALKELAAKHPHTKWKLDKLELAEGRIWRGRAQDAEPKPAMNAADVGIDAQTGQVMEFQFIPGR